LRKFTAFGLSPLNPPNRYRFGCLVAVGNPLQKRAIMIYLKGDGTKIVLRDFVEW
jgi:hypothetical protein